MNRIGIKGDTAAAIAVPADQAMMTLDPPAVHKGDHLLGTRGHCRSIGASRPVPCGIARVTMIFNPAFDPQGAPLGRILDVP